MKIERIQSYNFLGKVKRGAQKKKEAWDDKVKGFADKWKSAGNYLFDKMSKEELQNFLSRSYPTEIRLGKFKKVENKNGGMYKFLAGLPESKSYECGYVFRNGNDIRIYPHGTQFTTGNPEDPNQVKKIQLQALNWFDSEDDEAVKEFY